MKNFCYLGNRSNAGNGSEAVVTARTELDGQKCGECGKVLNGRGLVLKMEG